MEMRKNMQGFFVDGLTGQLAPASPFIFVFLCQALGVYCPLLGGCIYVAYHGGLRSREGGDK